jgi:hypothetical protein
MHSEFGKAPAPAEMEATWQTTQERNVTIEAWAELNANRCEQWHSVLVTLKHPIGEPPAVLFQGTATANWVAICDCSLAAPGASEFFCV